jgi:hypothetical protein
MTKISLILLALAAGASGQAAPSVSRATVIPVETSLDNRIGHFGVDDPVRILGGARGCYLQGFGVLVSTEVDLIPGASLTPFHPTFTKEEKTKLRAKKLEKIGRLRDVLLEALVDAAAMLDTVPADDQVAVAITIFKNSWEDAAGMPGQIVMQAPKKALVQYKTSTSKTRLETLQAVLKVQEY